MARLLVFLVLVLVFEQGFAQSEKKVLVELFTSQGCSSCPGADKLLKEVVEMGDDRIVVLSYHVDYWNRLGWKDPFSITESTQRQYAYAPIFRNTSVYTPQAIVNGEVEFVGSDRYKMNTSISSAKKTSRLKSLKMEVTSNENEVEVSITDGVEQAKTYIMLVQREAVTKVNRGENGGRTLSHVNVVRTIKILDSGKLRLKVPSDVSGKLAIVGIQETMAGKLIALGEFELQ